MNAALSGVLNGLSAIAINSLWQDALLVAVAWALVRCWPRLNAVTRYAIWSATLAAAVVVPVVTTLSVLAPATQQNAAALHASATAVGKTLVPPTLVRRVTTRTGATHSRPVASPALPARFGLTLPAWAAAAIAGVWTITALFFLIRLAVGLVRLERLKRDALPLTPDYRDAMHRWNDAAKGSRDVRLCVSQEIDVPVAVGLFDSMILIPQVLVETLSPDEIDQIGLHELAHLRRADDWTNAFQRFVQALFAWNPAVQFIGSQLDLEREVACDDWVVSITRTVRPYAMCLTKMAETTAWPQAPIAAPGVFNTRKNISLRIERLLQAGRNIATHLRFGPAAAAVAFFVALGLIAGAVTPSFAAPQTPAAPSLALLPSIAPSATPAPARTIHLPATDVHVPANDVHVPAIDVHVPAIDVHVPGTNLRIPTTQIADFANHHFTGQDFSRANWSGRDMRDGKFVGVDFSRGTFVGTNFSSGAFSGVDFSKSDLRNASFRSASITGCNFSRTDLSGVDFERAQIANCDFSHARLDRAKLTGAVLSNCDLDGVDLSHADLSGIKLVDTILPNQRSPQ